jgi:hypothetical protein
VAKDLKDTYGKEGERAARTIEQELEKALGTTDAAEERQAIGAAAKAAQKAAQALGKKAAQKAAQAPGSRAADEAEASTLERDMAQASREAVQAVNDALRDLKAGTSIPKKQYTVEGLMDAAQELGPLVKDWPQVPPGLVQDLSQILQQARLELAGEYVEGQTSGRLNMRALMRPFITRPNVFKKFVPSREDEAQFSLILYIDRSGSMEDNDPTGLALATGFALAEAARQNGSEVFVVGFAGRPYALSLPHEEGLRVRAPTGGTMIGPALDAALALTVNAQYRLVQIIIGDGAFTDLGELDRLRALTPLNYMLLILPEEWWQAMEAGREVPYVGVLRQNLPLYPLRSVEALPRALEGIVDQLMQDRIAEAQG